MTAQVRKLSPHFEVPNKRQLDAPLNPTPLGLSIAPTYHHLSSFLFTRHFSTLHIVISLRIFKVENPLPQVNRIGVDHYCLGSSLTPLHHGVCTWSVPAYLSHLSHTHTPPPSVLHSFFRSPNTRDQLNTTVMRLSFAVLTAALQAAVSTASTLTPPVLPLIVRNPYLSTWFGNAREAPWSKWPMFYTGEEVGLSLMAHVPSTGTVYPLLGKPHESLSSDSE